MVKIQITWKLFFSPAFLQGGLSMFDYFRDKTFFANFRQSKFSLFKQIYIWPSMEIICLFGRSLHLCLVQLTALSSVSYHYCLIIFPFILIKHFRLTEPRWNESSFEDALCDHCLFITYTGQVICRPLSTGGWLARESSLITSYPILQSICAQNNMPICVQGFINVLSNDYVSRQIIGSRNEYEKHDIEGLTVL
jgi:hypothetical protein